MLTASVKASQAFVSSTVQWKPETQSAASALSQPLENLKPAPIQSGKHLMAEVDVIIINLFLFLKCDY